MCCERLGVGRRAANTTMKNNNFESQGKEKGLLICNFKYMKELIVKIPDESSELVTQLLEKLGAEIKEKKTTQRSSSPKGKPGKKSVPPAKSKLPRKIDHTFLFGKWKNFDIDPKKLRKETW
jgi:hypothetical protein